MFLFTIWEEPRGIPDRDVQRLLSELRQSPPARRGSLVSFWTVHKKRKRAAVIPRTKTFVELSSVTVLLARTQIAAEPAQSRNEAAQDLLRPDFEPLGPPPPNSPIKR